IQNRSIVCTPFKTLPFTLVCRNDHPRINGKIEIEDLLQEKFTAFLSEEPGVKDYQQK
ncbi:MAG TPA: LysR family transcriptional regulator, partial [Leclercia adecarboxylata]|nr:LysR family transcriptional regulator [Leclercia adecarboxylata]